MKSKIKSVPADDATLNRAVQAALRESGFENYPLPNLSKYPPDQTVKAIKWARSLLDSRTKT